ncbi:MAG: ATPase, T2SS/T4P/T4SS family [Syntrophomonadaceae bacterium]|nr:ATPase, T2SS/T4P/T4SS family [Syntrophomonadaceae bacterium]
MFPRKKIGEILSDMGLISKEQLQSALQEQKKSGEKLGLILVNKGIISENQLLEILGMILGVPYIKLGDINIEPELIKLLPAQLIRFYKILPIARNSKVLTLAMADPFDQRAIDDVRMASGLDVVPVLTSEKEIDIAIHQNLAFRIDPDIDRIIEELIAENKIAAQARKNLQFLKLDEEAPIIRMVNSILIQAVQACCSDIHIEPQQEEVRIRFRLDGGLYQALNLPLNSLSPLVSRIKIMAGMDIAEKRLPQDGRFRMEIEGREVDFRTSTLPTSQGEKIMLRILDRAAALTNIGQLGLTLNNQKKILDLANKPYGLLLVTGPTGSGKTTTLYSILGNINSIDKNIITLEDPVEYSLTGINQVQINTKAGLTFASGLRSILRQDPDVILVGEIRDRETAQLAVQAALTGHLVFSTLHTNNAAGTIARLKDIGIDDFLLASSLAGIISQRLVRQLCSNCRQEYELDEDTAFRLGIAEKQGKTFFRPCGCNMCRQLGYRGRVAIQEILIIGPEIRAIVRQGENSEDMIEKTAIQAGMTAIKADGIAKASRGITSLEEVMRVVLIGG